MRKLLEALAKYLPFLYLDPAAKIVDSRSSGSPDFNASLTLRTPLLGWSLVVDRDPNVVLSLCPHLDRVGDRWYRVETVRQYVEGGREIGSSGIDAEMAQWVSGRLEEIKTLFGSPDRATQVCDELEQLLESNAEARWGPIKPRRSGPSGR